MTGARTARGGVEDRIADDIREGERADRPLRRFFRRLRAWIETKPGLRHGYRLVVGVVGGLIAVVGLILVPLPGPGWLVVFVGLALLGTEFAWAKRAAAFIKRQLVRFAAWVRRRREQRQARQRAAAAAGPSGHPF
ncbi:TIGR02611 family protein [Plantibacter sp. YIM 135249]|uniref:TIGR02611 family protein n=1 Tax=Plantibacter sp. YIM 135249 TaxID=3423918 RepID=UPI003D342AFA